MEAERLVWASVLLGSALLSLTWCSLSYARANPGRRLPGKLPETRQPPAYMPVGLLGVICAILGALAADGSVGIVMWLIAGGVTIVGLYPVQLMHNRRLGR